jgi:pimeloyl-ACP methyl ester carboxylesterase
LLETSLNDPEKAMHMINVFSRSTLAPPPSALGPGTWIFDASLALGRRVLSSNTAVNVFHRGFMACDQYANGLQAIGNISCPVLFLLGAQDQMTMPKAAQSLITQARSVGKTVTVEYVPVGHHQMTEAPEATLAKIASHLLHFS